MRLSWYRRAVTVEGPSEHSSLHRDIESTKQFIIIDQVELQRASTNQRVVASPGSGSRSLIGLS
jgi:hypothetical protein